MTNLQPIIDDLLHLQDKLAQLPFPHPWDNHVAKNSVARIDALVSDLRVVACRMREDQPRVTYDPATDQAMPVEKPEPLSHTISLKDSRDTVATNTAPDPQPITESLMRAAQVGWVVRTAGDLTGVVITAGFGVIEVRLKDVQRYIFRTYRHESAGVYKPEVGPTDYDIVSLVPPEVVEDVAEVLL